MKIKNYLATVILISLIGGFLIEIVLSQHFENVHLAVEKHNKSLLWKKDLDRLSADVSQYLVTTDLILGSDQTYLIQGALDKAHLIHSSIAELKQQDLQTALSVELSQSAQTISTIASYLTQAASLTGNDRPQRLYHYLVKSDQISGQLVQNLSGLRNQMDETVKVQAHSLSQMHEHSYFIKILCGGLFFLLILALWVWANRQISKPLLALTEMAKAAENGIAFSGINKGPKEVIELSNNTQRLTQSLSYQATHDPLTSLFNRRKFEHILTEQLSLLTKGESVGSTFLCYLDLDHFKIVNDNCGHAAGDELLEQVSRLLQSSAKSTDTVARLGGDEFVLLLSDYEQNAALDICNNIRNAIMKIRYHWDDNVYQISASIGIVEITPQCLTIKDVLNAADTACNLAKESGRDRIHLFDIEDESLAIKRNEMILVHQITSAIEENQFELHRQFIIPLQETEKPYSHFEILLRMLSPAGKLIYPDNFLPLVEKHQLGARMDQWVINTIIDWLLANPDELHNTKICAINLSGQSLVSDRVQEQIVKKLSETKFPAEKLCFEITETAAIADLHHASKFISKLRALGCKFALDDFGTGLASFSYLKSLEVDIIKIDGSFVKDMTTDSVNMATVKSISEVAKALGKKTIAEFVENEEITHKLTAMGVDYAQGYHFSKPMPLFSKPKPLSHHNADSLTQANG